MDRLLEDRAEPGHGHEVDVVAGERVDDLVRVRDPVEVGAEAGAGHHTAGTPAASARPVAAHGRSTITTAIGRPASRSDCRMVPLPDAKTPIRTWLNLSRVARGDPSGSGVRRGSRATVQHSSLPGEDGCSRRSRVPSSPSWRPGSR